MRNLKRVLSLAMASVMLMGMMVIGASAANFPDSDKIEHTDAVDTMVSLGIIKGKDDGNFDPEGIVTRAEMAKMICVALNGGKDPNLGSSGGLFPDTVGNWAAGYIDFCANRGIVAGDEKGNFNPSKTVTGTEAAKMILIALGYNAETEGFVGNAKWDININVLAGTVGLYDNVAINSSEGLTRDNAAQMLYDGMQADMVKYEMVGIVGGNGISQAVSKGENILESKFDMKTDVIVLTSVKPDKNDTYKIAGDKVDNAVNGNFSKVKSDYSSLLGQEVKVLYKKDKTDEVYGVYATNNNNTVTYNVSAAEATSDGKVKVDGTKYELVKDGVAAIIDGVYDKDADLKASNPKLVNSVGYNTVTLVDNNDDDKYEIAVITTVTPAKVTYVSSSEIIAGGTTYKFDDHNIEDGIKKNDYVTVTYNVANDENDIVKLEKESGKVTGYKVADSKYKYLVDGTWYISAEDQDSIKAGDTMDYVAVNGVVFWAEKTSDSANINNLVMLLFAESGLNSQAKFIGTDGVKQTVKVSDDNDATLTPGELYTYSEKDDGYKFTAVANNDEIGDYKYTIDGTVDNNSNNKINKIGSDLVVETATVFLWNGLATNKSDAKIITGKQLMNSKATASDDKTVNTTAVGSFTSKVNGLTRVSIAAVKWNSTDNKLPDIDVGGKNYALIVDSAYQQDSDYITYAIWNGDETITVREKSSTVPANRSQFDVIKYDSIDGDVIKGLVDVPAAASGSGKLIVGAVYGVLDDQMFVSDSQGYDLTSDTVYMGYDSSTTTAKDIGKPADEDSLIQADTNAGVYINNVKYVINDENKVVFVLIDAKNSIKDTAGVTAATSGSVTNASVELSKTAKVQKGESITVTITASGGAVNAKITLTNAKFADDADATDKTVSLADGGKAVVTIVADGVGDVGVAIATP